MGEIAAYTAFLERRLEGRSDRLEETHLEAAIDAQLTATTDGDQHAAGDSTLEEKPALFDDYINPYAVSNCLSPYVPASSEKIAAFILLASVTDNDILLDIGCGDGRVCVAAAKLTGCRSIGLDISPPCIEQAKELAREEEIERLCQFYQADATDDPHRLFEDSSLASALQSVTVVWLFTYPTLLRRLVPLLTVLRQAGARIVTLTYHLTEAEAAVHTKDTATDLCLYSSVHM